MRIFTRRLAVVAALAGVALMASSAEACHKRRCGGRSACAGGYGGGGGCAGGYGGYGGQPPMASYPGTPYGGYPGMASYPSTQAGTYSGMASYPTAPYGGTMVSSPYNPGMPGPGSYTSAYGTMPGAPMTTAPVAVGGSVMPGAPGASVIPPAPVTGGFVPAAPAPAPPTIPR